MTSSSVRGLQCAFFYEPNVFCRWCWLGPYLPCYICTDQSQLNMYHRWLDTRERDLFLPTCGRSKFSRSDIMGLSLYVTIFKNLFLLLLFFFVLEFLRVSSEWKVVISMKHSFLDYAFLILYQAVCLNIFCEI